MDELTRRGLVNAVVRRRRFSAVTSEQQELLARRRAGFDKWLAERMAVLRDFAAALELPDPPLILADPERYLPAIDAWLEDQVVESDDWAWAVSRVGYFAGEVLVQRFAGCWLVCDAPNSRFFGRYVVGQFRLASNPAAIADPIEVAAACLSQPPGRSLGRMLEAVGVELRGAEPSVGPEPRSGLGKWMR